jgi:hypothetical protein
MSDGTLQTLDVSMLDDVGTGANQLIQLDSNAKIPACSGAAITGLSSVTKNASDPIITTNPSGGVGSVWQNTTSGEMFICTDATAGANVWINVGEGSGDVEPVTWLGTRGLFGAGWNYSPLNTIDYITIATPGNAIDFGDLTNLGREGMTGFGGAGRGCFAGGWDRSPSATLNIIDYVTVATIGNAVDFGDLTNARYYLGACCNGTRGLIGPGATYSPWVTRDTIDYVTIATTGNATDFGNFSVVSYQTGALANETRGVFAGGTTLNNMEYVTVATAGNTIDFGDLTEARMGPQGTSSSTRGLFMGGNGPSDNTIDYITIATTGNATDFGDLVGINEGAATCSGLNGRGVYGGGHPPIYSNIIQYVTIASTGNATDFGDLTLARGGNPGGCQG